MHSTGISSINRSSPKMIYSLVYYPAIDTEGIHQIRRRFDPQFQLIEPHITVMFPVPDSIGEYKLIDHVSGVVRETRSFPIQLQGLSRSSDDYLFLLVEEGKDGITDLYERVYTGVLSTYKKNDLPYVPHVTLGAFHEKGNEYEQALSEAKQLDLNYRCFMDKLHLVTIDDQLTRIVASREIPLS